MCCWKPCAPAEILADGKFGRLVPPGDEAGFAEALKDMIEGRGPNPSAQEIHAQLRLFDPETIRSHYIAFVEHCLSHPVAA